VRGREVNYNASVKLILDNAILLRKESSVKTNKTIMVLCFACSVITFFNIADVRAQEISDLEGNWDFHTLTSGDSSD